ncbi:MAG: prepilin-type N-terminal cleavage/methylation domain-containing protein [Hyphomicrobium sp.]
MAMPAKHPSKGNEGFALSELLISLTILALLLAMLPGTLRLGKRAWETPGALADAPAAAALTFAGQHLKSALPVFETNNSGLPRLAFSGTERGVRFIAELATGPRGGGLYRIDIGSDTAASRPGVRLALYRGSSNEAESAVETRDLSSAFDKLQFRYFGASAPGEPAQWQAAWDRQDRLPDLVDVVATGAPGSATKPFELRAEIKLRPVQ